MAANDRQVAGTHYKNGAYQHWDYMADIRANYFEGCITKYVSRSRKKNGLQDLQKARHFVEKWHEVCVKEGIRQCTHDSLLFNRFVYDNGLTPDEANICQVVLFASSPHDLQTAARMIDELIDCHPDSRYVNQ